LSTNLLFLFVTPINLLLFTPYGAHSNGIRPLQVAFGEGRMPSNL